MVTRVRPSSRPRVKPNPADDDWRDDSSFGDDVAQSQDLPRDAIAKDRGSDVVHASHDRDDTSVQPVRRDVDDVHEWRPRQHLPELPPRVGFKRRWIRARHQDRDDIDNSRGAWNEGWRPCDPSTVPGYDDVAPQSHRVFGSSCIMVGDLIACEMREERNAQRNAHYVDQSDRMVQAVEQQLQDAADPAVPIGQRLQSRVTVGRGRPPVQPD